MEFKHRDNAVFCELVCLCEAGWLTSVFTLCPFVTQISEQTKKKKKLVPNKFLNETFTDLSVTASSQKTFFLSSNNYVLRWFSYLTTPCSTTML